MKHLNEAYEGLSKEELTIILKHNRKLVSLVQHQRKDRKKSVEEITYLGLIEKWYNEVLIDLKKRIDSKETDK